MIIFKAYRKHVSENSSYYSMNANQTHFDELVVITIKIDFTPDGKQGFTFALL